MSENGQLVDGQGEGQPRTCAFLDANIILECRELAKLPWEEIDAVGPIRLLITPRVASEVDKRKRDGRLAKRARAFNQLLGQTLAGGAAVIRDAGPRVELARAPLTAIDWERLSDLDREEADQRIVAEILHARGVDPASKVVVSHDINPLGVAQDHGLRIHHVGDHWLLPPEPSPTEKEMQRLKGRIAVLEADQPEFEIQIDVPAAAPALLRRFGPLGADQQRELLNALLDELDKPQNGGFSMGFDPLRDASFDGRWDAYTDRTLPAFVEAYAEKMELIYNQRQLLVSVRNVGAVQASDLTVEISTSHGWINGAYVMVSPRGPTPPRPRSPLNYTPPNFFDRYDGWRVGRHEFSWTEPPKRTQRCVAACAAFATDQAWTFGGALFLDVHADAAVEVTVKVRASNLRGAAEETLRVEVEAVDGPPPTILEGNLLEIDPPPVMQALLTVEDLDDDMVELDGEDSG